MASTTIRPQRSARSGLASVLGFILMTAAAGGARAETEALDPFQPSPLPAFTAPGPQYPLYAQAAPVPLRTRQWYGYQIMGSDLASIVLLFAGQAAPVGGISLFAAPPVIHGVHHNVTMAIASPLMRVGLPLVGGAIGGSMEDCSNAQEDSFCGLGGAILGMGAGLLTAMILDYSMAFEETEVPSHTGQAPQPPRQPSRISLTTAGVAPTTNGATLVLGGRF